MMTREIPQDQWMPFLNDFSRRHQGERVTVEVLQGEEGIHALATNVPLVGITDDPKNSEGEMIEVMAGDSPDNQVTHDIRRPCCVRVAAADDGRDVAVAIDSSAMPRTIIRFGGPEWPEMYGPKPS
jgi:hypothetical protein